MKTAEDAKKNNFLCVLGGFKLVRVYPRVSAAEKLRYYRK